MANDVFANGREISCKAADGKAIAAFPDVCMTPPENPTTPPGVPVPYPNTGMAKDATSGSKSVKISRKEVMLKNKSYFKKSTGDEAGSATKKGVVTSKNRGKVYFTAWSMDVKFEGENVVRHLDMTTHNHASTPGNSPPWCYIDSMTLAQKKDCKEDKKEEEEACSKDGTSRGDETQYKSAEECCDDEDCKKARNCMLVPYGGSGSPNCCPGVTGHHLLPNSLLQGKRGDSSTNVVGLKKAGDNAYTVNKGACVCVKGSGSSGDHGKLHDKSKEKLRGILEAGEHLDYDTAKEKVVEAHNETFPQCSKACTDAQIEASLKKSKTGSEIKVRQKDGITRKNFDRYTDGDLD
ncbi:DUF4150 domain-containing protein [Halomonas sp. H5]|uniref:DUF4150 domain-containing protein n=1 Tax=Halomonas sp. H5 TaxID=3423910 RepID=UPI003D369582